MYIKLFIYLLVNLYTIYEGTKGLLQVIGLGLSKHTGFLVTGSFTNPGPYGGFIAFSLSILGTYYFINKDAKEWYLKVLQILSVISCIICLIILPATMSRAAWLALGVTVLVLGLKEFSLANLIRKHKAVAAISFVILVTAMVGVFFLKKESAIGRLHIWHMELLAIAEEPLTGHGKGSVLGVYGDTQAKYFSEKERPDIIKKVAGCPEYAFNEYLKIGVEYGVPVMVGVIILLVLVIALLLKFRSPFAYGLIAFCVFAFFSYPLEAVHIKTDAEEEWNSIRYFSSMGLYEDSVEELAPLYDDLKDNYRYIYDYGYALHKCKRYQESIDILKAGTDISSDPMFYNIIGKNYEALKIYDEAEKAYLHAHYMVPYRLYPLTLLMKLKIKLREDTQALKYARKIISMPINEDHLEMSCLHNDAKKYINSLSK